MWKILMNIFRKLDFINMKHTRPPLNLWGTGKAAKVLPEERFKFSRGMILTLTSCPRET